MFVKYFVLVLALFTLSCQNEKAQNADTDVNAASRKSGVSTSQSKVKPKKVTATEEHADMFPRDQRPTDLSEILVEEIEAPPALQEEKVAGLEGFGICIGKKKHYIKACTCRGKNTCSYPLTNPGDICTIGSSSGLMCCGTKVVCR